MPTHGGTSDKFGNRYEILWAADQLLRILKDKALDFTLEPISSEESKGIEFKVSNADGTVDYWSNWERSTSSLWGGSTRTHPVVGIAISRIWVRALVGSRLH